MYTATKKIGKHKTYQTRNGRKVMILGIANSTLRLTQPVIGFIEPTDESKSWVQANWNEFGQHELGRTESDLDLMLASQVGNTNDSLEKLRKVIDDNDPDFLGRAVASRIIK